MECPGFTTLINDDVAWIMSMSDAHQRASAQFIPAITIDPALEPVGTGTDDGDMNLDNTMNDDAVEEDIIDNATHINTAETIVQGANNAPVDATNLEILTRLSSNAVAVASMVNHNAGCDIAGVKVYFDTKEKYAANYIILAAQKNGTLWHGQFMEVIVYLGSKLEGVDIVDKNRTIADLVVQFTIHSQMPCPDKKSESGRTRIQ
ncbi:hypothetical protein PWT90_03759 [Aphanocladium album]|nr:hypothetical protein PWT90_03759 [Aphanocladium album]